MYIGWDDVMLRYPSIADVGGSKEVGSAHIQYAENELNGRLAPKFTIPFSSNNQTAKDLSIEMTYLRIGNFNTKEREALKTSIDERIVRLLDGDENMVDDTGNTIQQSVGGTVWSNTKDYTPTFGFGDTEDFEVDPDLIDAEESARS